MLAKVKQSISSIIGNLKNTFDLSAYPVRLLEHIAYVDF